MDESMVKHLIFLALGMFTIGCNIFLMAGLLPQIGQTIGQSISVTGQGITFFSVSYLISAPLFSVLFANKMIKPIIQLALSLFVLGTFITLLSDNIILFLMGRAIAGLGAGIFTPLCITIAVNYVRTSAKGRALSFIWSANSAGVVFGVPLGLYLSSIYNWQSSLTYILLMGLIALIGFSRQDINITLPQTSSFKETVLLYLDSKTLSIIGITCFTALASLGLFSYIAPILSDSPNSLPLTLFCWGLGGFIGSSVVGIFIDRTEKPRLIMAIILAGLMLTILSIPFTKNLPYFGLIPFFLWGAFGWATTNPQQQVLFDLHTKQGTILAAINSSAFGLGGAIGTSLGGLIISSGVKEIYLPYPAASVLLVVLICQIMIIKSSKRNRNHE